MAQATTVAWFPSLASELPYTAGMALEKKKKKIQIGVPVVVLLRAAVQVTDVAWISLIAVAVAVT